MLRLADGRERLYQWDLSVRLMLTEPEGIRIDEVHFTNTLFTSAPVVAVERREDGVFVAVPNILLQHHWPIHAYCVCTNESGRITRECFVFEVEARQKPDDYVYTETEVKSWDALDERVSELEKNGGGGGGGAKLSDEMPMMNGEASAGVSNEVSRADHTHPTDTTRMPAITEMESGDISDSSKIPYMDDAAAMRYMTWDRIIALANAAAFYYIVSDTLPLMNGEVTPGSAGKLSRADHVHPIDTSRMPADIAGLDKLVSRGRKITGTDKLIVEDSKEGKPKYCTWTEICSEITSLFGPAISDALLNYYSIPETETFVQEYAQAKGDYLIPQDLAGHNTATDSHNDMRLLIEGLTSRLNTLADSDDDTLDQLSEVVAYIKDNRELIESVTTSKVNVTDIVDNLTTNVTGKPLAASQGVAIKALIDALSSGKLDSSTFNASITNYYNKAQTESYVAGYAQPKGDYALKSELPSVPVQSVNGKTGAVKLGASDVGAQPAGDYATRDELPSVPVKSVNGKTGAVQLGAGDVGAVPTSQTITLKGVDENGATHTWTVYGVKS